ncbi:alpha/beta fold hydrolase [Novosphingobium sp. JCM 18896]|uniref:alpha/beta fold hydrolase n=1 Tax=Novosphingobium sp. JCM 18896 TaxID=2989731 RepID=UPI002221F224|nr:alpha/beta hydrolase [Novosphingobium sp. JCM 18896]MCW1430450.1 alpha/beta hydrolase [Novosphingobium sp. JCM 18896]
MTEFADCYWTSRDGLKLHYRDYSGPAERPALLCLPGLTRNARDFENLAARLAGQWRVIAPDMRGRGDSAYAKDSATYNPFQYVDDVNHLLDEAGVDRYVAIGTSLGGLMTMILAMNAPERIAGAVINDVGPVLEPAGLARIGAYVGQGRSFPTWMHAARAIEETQAGSYPGYGIDDWLAVAKRLMVLSSNGRIVFDYDMKIAEPFARIEAGPQPDLWPGIEALAGKPVLLLRGALSDLLSAQTLEQMRAALPGAETVTIAQVGHAPTLDEPEAVAAIERLLTRCA